jgi:NADPH:quinone reductase
MRAYILESLDNAPSIIDVPEPDIADNEVLVRVESASANPIDRDIVSGAVRDWMEYEFPVTLGRDLAGTLERVGPAVTRFEVGDKVFGFIAKPTAHDGSFADYVAVPEDQFIVHRPDGLGALEAGALGLASVTALMCTDATGLEPGDTLIVNGATGGVGGYAVQIGKAAGARVVASARPGREERHVRALGADATFDWSSGDVVAAIRSVQPDAAERLVDVVTGTPEALTALVRGTLSPGAHVATTRGAFDPDQLGGFEGTNVFSMADTALMTRIADLIRAGKLRATVTEVHPFERIDEAFEALSLGSLGKIAIRLAEES